MRVAMQDAQVPTESEDEASDAPRRAGLRLRDAEVVATARRDMFGDGSLIDTLAGSPTTPEATTENPADPAAPTQSAEPSPPEGDAAGGQADTAQPPDLPEAAGPAGPEPLANVAQSIDTIIDSFPSEPAAGVLPQIGEEGAGPGLTAAPPSEPLPGAGPAIATPQMGISSLFDSLGSIEQPVGDAQPVEEPPAPSAPSLELDMSMLELRVPVQPVLQPESDPPAAAPPSAAPPPSLDPEPPAHQVETAELLPGELDLDMSMLEQRPPARPVLRSESNPSEAGLPYGDPSASFGGELEADGVRTGRFEIDLASAAAASAGPDALAHEPGDPSVADYSQTLGTGAAHFTAADTLPDLAEPPQAADTQPPIEPLVMSTFAEPSEPAGYGEPSLRGPANVHEYLEPLEMPADPEAAAQPMFDSAAKIAAEAQATAEALDSLKRLLVQSTPGLEEPTQAPAQGQGEVRLNLHGDPIPFPSRGRAALMPMPVPERGSARGIYALGFLMGVGLALMAGIALYILINII